MALRPLLRGSQRRSHSRQEGSRLCRDGRSCQSSHVLLRQVQCQPGGESRRWNEADAQETLWGYESYFLSSFLFFQEVLQIRYH
ncbi:hypothetical protein LINGRAHAP2_LOCUS6614 [Linum grandiflorum]